MPEGLLTSSALKVTGLTRRYGARAAVDGLNLEVQPGDLYGFLGPNGAGKTTVIRCVLGLIRRDAGEVSVFGEADPVRQRADVGAIVETPRFHEWLSARANLEVACAYAGRGDSASVEEALERVGLRERAKEPVGGYSLGMKQRLGIARALVGKPRLLILDEPVNGLDPRGMAEVRTLLKELVRRDGLTVFVSSHLLAELEGMVTRVGIIDRGVLRAEGTLQGLLAAAEGKVEVELGVTDRVAALEVLGRTEGVSLLGDGADGALRVALSGLTVPDFNRRLVGAGVGVERLVAQSRRLEDLFLQVTERGLG